jgi:hypothetical protein
MPGGCQLTRCSIWHVGVHICIMWENPLLGPFANKRVPGLWPVTWNASGGNLRSDLLHRPTAPASSLRLTCWYADGTRNWQHALASAQYESCLLPLPRPSSVVHPAPACSFGPRTDNPLFCLGPNLYILHMPVIGAICKLLSKERVSGRVCFVIYIWHLISQTTSRISMAFGAGWVVGLVLVHLV